MEFGARKEGVGCRVTRCINLRQLIRLQAMIASEGRAGRFAKTKAIVTSAISHWFVDGHAVDTEQRARRLVGRQKLILVAGAQTIPSVPRRCGPSDEMLAIREQPQSPA